MLLNSEKTRFVVPTTVSHLTSHISHLLLKLYRFSFVFSLNHLAMSTDQNKPAKDKIHSPELGETQDFEELSFNKERNTFELDVKGDDPVYDHPFPYETPSDNGADSNSDFDEANLYVGDEYAKKEEQEENALENLAMHIDHGQSVILSDEDELLSRTPEDERDDLDEEGYPINH